MKIVQVTKLFIYQNTLFPVEQIIDRPIYAAVPDILADSLKVILIQNDTAPWFTSSNFLQIWVENMKVEIIALVSSSPEEVRKLIDEYNSFYKDWLNMRSSEENKKTSNKTTIDLLNNLYFNN